MMPSWSGQKVGHDGYTPGPFDAQSDPMAKTCAFCFFSYKLYTVETPLGPSVSGRGIPTGDVRDGVVMMSCPAR